MSTAQPKLAEQLRTDQLDSSHARQILDVYLRWKLAGFDATALLAAAPAASRAGLGCCRKSIPTTGPGGALPA